MQKLGVPQTRIDHIVKQNDPELVANLVKELQGQVGDAIACRSSTARRNACHFTAAS